MNGRGTVRRTFQPERYTLGVNPTPTQALTVPGTPYEMSGYDAFDRPTLRMPPMGGTYFTTYHALTRDECDPRDNEPAGPHTGTCTTIRLDGHGRVIDQVLRNRQPGVGSAMEYYRLYTEYRADGAVTVIRRAETDGDANRGSPGLVELAGINRTFTYDTAGRRIGTTDPDSDSYSLSRTPRNATWRYLFNRVGDLVAVRDPRGCGQDFYYDRAARLVAEDYIGCAESSFVNETTDLDLPVNSIGLADNITDLREVDVLYQFDSLPTWATGLPGLPATSLYAGRLGGVSDRGERSVMAYDNRGQVTWTARQMTVIRAAPTLTIGTGADGRPTVSSAPAANNRVYDTVASHTYTRTASYDHGGRPTSMSLPRDPDYGGTAPAIGGTLTYNNRGLPSTVTLTRDAATHPVIGAITYTRDGLVNQVFYGDTLGGSRTATTATMTYDDRRRPSDMLTTRVATAIMTPARPLGAVTIPFSQGLTWDLADNLTAIDDDRVGAEWPNGYRPQNVVVTHDSLYRVAAADYTYRADDNKNQATDTAVNWRTEANITRSDDPMRSRPAPMIDGLPASRPVNMTWEYDWLGNAEEWTDDAHQFYERSIGDIVNGSESTTMERPGSLALSTDFGGPDTDRGGWLEVDYGEDGNATAMTVHAACVAAPTYSCKDPGGTDLAARRAEIRTRCTCAQEQHYVYRWDEVNRVAEAMRFDRTGGSGGWTLMVRQRYLYDSANERTVKQTLDQDVMSSRPEAVALYVYPGDFERRGLVRNTAGTSYDALGDAETQYVVGGARLVWRTGTRSPTTGVDRDQRLTIGLSDIIQSTNVTLDLMTGELVETGNYYANGARESYRSGSNGERSAAEPMGFTGKEADEEVGLTYFGQRYLMSHLGRWASPDPLQTHAVGGGEALNGYHYVAGNVLQARDPQGLDADAGTSADTPASAPPTATPPPDPTETLRADSRFTALPAILQDAAEEAVHRGTRGVEDVLAIATRDVSAMRNVQVDGDAARVEVFGQYLLSAMMLDPAFEAEVDAHSTDGNGAVVFHLVGATSSIHGDRAHVRTAGGAVGEHTVDMTDLDAMDRAYYDGLTTSRVQENVIHFVTEAMEEVWAAGSGTVESSAEGRQIYLPAHLEGLAAQNRFRETVGIAGRVVRAEMESVPGGAVYGVTVFDTIPAERWNLGLPTILPYALLHGD